MDWHAENQLQTFMKFRAMGEYQIAGQKIHTDIQFNTMMMILSAEGYTGF